LTEKDFEEMEFEDLLGYDKRPYLRKVWINLRNENSLLSLIFKRSLIYPMHLRLFQFLFDFYIDCGANAIFYTDEYISKRFENGDNTVK